ncbi:ABC transporter substrate-binding protein [Cohnella silvisoli]|uniref:Extracellular solute-binding protein n=1 Tax=Cohnella silvisoli TaxID=2873699 RepID=A0ABV1KLQ1_9BACL|nr:extracellular solute-binding protein [Cohnella silvisoli]MCD9020770.1 extracellular solute-binding protein [Cohnella silvisoli]
MKRRTSGFIILLVLFIIVSGCGKADKKAVESKQTESAAPSQSAQSSVDNKKQEPVKLKFLTNVIDYPKHESEINAALHQAYPHITVEFEHVADNYDAVLKTRLASGDAPDLFNYPGYLAMKPLVDAGQVLDLSNDNPDELVYENFRNAGKYNGKVYGVPTQVLGYGLIYNKQAFQEAGIAAPPNTLTELKDAIAKLQKAGITPFASGFKDVWLCYQMFWALQGSTLDDFQKFYDDMNGGNASFKNEKLDAAFELLDLYVANSGDKPLSSDFANMAHLVGTKKAAMAIQGVWAYGEAIKLDPDVQLGMAPIPVSEDAKDATLLTDAEGIMYISKDTKHANEAKDFIRWMLSKEGAKATVGDILQQQSAASSNPELKLNSLSLDAAQYIQEGKKTRGFMINYWQSGLADIIGKDLQDYISKNLTRDDFYKHIDAGWKIFAGK